MKTIREIMDVLEPDEDDGWEAVYANKQKIEKNIRFAFKHCQIDISDEHGAVYFDTDDRTATVELDDIEISTSKLFMLMKSGLSNDYTIRTGNGNLVLEFIVNTSLDDTI